MLAFSLVVPGRAFQQSEDNQGRSSLVYLSNNADGRCINIDGRCINIDINII